jgi:hypothetical protein
MRCLGLRVAPTIVFFSVADYDISDDSINILTTDKITIPVSMDTPDRLSYVRTALFSIIKEYDIVNAGIRRMEDNMPSRNLEPIIARAYLEGVIQELISNCMIEKYFSGKISKIGSLLEQKPQDIKASIEGESNLYDLDGWELYKSEERESVLCAIAASQI